MNPIPYARQDINDSDIESVIKILRSDWLTQGPAIERFEETVKNYCGVRYAVAACNGTAALHLAYRALGLQPGDSLWTSPNTFVATANCALYCGARVDFVDIDPQTYNISIEALEHKLTQADKEGRLPKIVVPVHFAGQPCDMGRIHLLSKRYGFHVIEDACHAIGARYHDDVIGSCRYSDMTVFSFHPVKIITTGEGGMVTTNNEELYERLLLLRNHGITRKPDRMQEPPHGPWYYQQIDLGYNYRMTDLQAALGVSQMQRLNQFVTKRHAIASCYNEALKPFPLKIPYQKSGCYSSYHLYVVCLKLGKIKKGRREVVEALHRAGIHVNVHYIPVHTQPYYRKLGFKPVTFPESEKFYGEAMSLPMFYGLREEDQQRVVTALKEVICGS